ncbi:MAG TPA: flagellar motor switch protein FliG [Casimicrobiaceae bacterium]|nr:flagellar motor switch protein FliG [Casimicrobiaceae bacterium]
MSDTGTQNTAILLMSLGEAEAAEVLRHLAPREVEKIGQAISKLTAVTRDRIDEVLDAFNEQAQQQTTIGLDADGYLRSVLTRALGDDRAAYLLDRILDGGNAAGMEKLRWMDAPAISELIGGEHPQIIASILVHLDRDQASGVLAAFGETLRNDVLLRVATLDRIQPAALRELNEVLQKLLSGNGGARKSAPGGVRVAAEMLNHLASAQETAAIEAVRVHDAELADKLLDEMFIFENLLDLDDRGVQALLREVQSESLIVALKGASETLREKVFKNMSQRAAEMLRDDLDAKGPVRISEVESEQKEILKIVRRMADEGQLVLGSKGGDAFV